MSHDSISIIVTAYNAQNFIGACMMSMCSVLSKFKTDYEVLIGVDGCSKTLDVLKNVLKPKNSRVFWFNRNHGTYVVSNTLLTMKRYSRVLRFDSDDLMQPACLTYMDVNISPPGGIYRIPYFNFTVKNGRTYFRGLGKYYIPVMPGVRQIPAGRPAFEHACGTVIYDDAVLAKVGGYKAWRCAADTDMMDRAKRAGIKIKKLDPRHGPAHFRRRHRDSLTCAKDTDQNSALRKKYKLEATTDTTIYVTPVTASCDLIQ